MNIVNLKQGTSEWHAFRANHFTASEAGAMLGESPYKTRTELLDEKKTGLTKEVDSVTQSRFNKGHEYEALARVEAEKLIGEELYPVTAHEGRLSASFDGLTMDGSICWEHKTLNKELEECKSQEDLPTHIRAQIEQQLMISGAEKCLFMASKWTNGELETMVSFDVYPDSELRNRIIQGWAQFIKDLENHVPTAPVKQIDPEVISGLPALVVITKGEVTQSNLPHFKQAVDTFIAQIKTDLVTDEDFVNAAENVKFLKETEAKLKLAKEQILEQTADIAEIMRAIDEGLERIGKTRLSLDKDVKSKKEQIRLNIINEVRHAYNQFIYELEEVIKPFKLNAPQPDFAGSMKNKSTFSSLKNAVNTCLAESKITANQIFEIVKINKAHLRTEAKDFTFLFADAQQIIYKEPDDFALLVKSRIENHKAELAAKEAAKLEEENAKAAKAEAAEEVIKSEPVQVSKTTSEATTKLIKTEADIINLVANAYSLSLYEAENLLAKMNFRKAA